MPLIPLFTPDMPTAEQLLPYLREIDKDRWYSNFGPKVRLFEERLADYYHLDCSDVVTVSNATSGLVATLSCVFPYGNNRVPGQPVRCLLPGWTFVATAQSVLLAGMTPIFCDVDSVTGILEPELVKNFIENADTPKIDVVLTVAPFGSGVDVQSWDLFSAEYGIPVVIDAAASFEALVPGNSPAIVSFHATKFFGIGEGGGIFTKNTPLAEKIKQFTRFGFGDSRVAMRAGGNFKLSEYHAAVGLAQFDRFDELKARYQFVRDCFVSELGGSHSVRLFQGEAKKVSSTFNVIVDGVGVENLVSGLNSAGVNAGVWWQDILYKNPVFSAEGISGLFPVSDFLYSHVLALPFSSSFTDKEVVKAVGSLKSLIENV
ncbi:DegT/DnrJ/EryC1/StrS family aminotransferase [Kiloniella laminariae]|uniref:DegT/DnrJ/EryC1/StrS family aminotransferase n=1 Tax=Kiloniella laminariae TaxID=454162 RepID=UPI000688D918|nr:DegT/DnrJ/EryC1/StrS family aminotransferase [Kiloniella laminariae]